MFFSAPALLSFCERAIDGFPRYPAETWTNIGPLLAGFWIWRATRRDQLPQLKLLGSTAVFLALSSACFHATGKRWGELLDLAAMYAYVSCLIWYAWIRNPLPRAAGMTISLAVLALGVSTAVSKPEWGLQMFGGLIAAVVVGEVLTTRRLTGQDWRWLGAAGASSAVAYLAWWLDFHKIWCDPDNHVLSLHGVWHLLNALPFLFLYRHYRQSLR